MSKETKCVATFGADAEGNPDVTVTFGSARSSVTFCVSADQAEQFAQHVLAAASMAKKCFERQKTESV